MALKESNSEFSLQNCRMILITLRQEGHCSPKFSMRRSQVLAADGDEHMAVMHAFMQAYSVASISREDMAPS